jgi:hypothetical protein
MLLQSIDTSSEEDWIFIMKSVICMSHSIIVPTVLRVQACSEATPTAHDKAP